MPKTRTSNGPDAAQPTGRSPEKHQRILDAAIAVIAENGFFQSRVSEIAERAGVADGTIYLYFRNKEQILMAAIDAAFAAFLERARRELEPDSPPAEKLRRLARLHLDALGSNRAMAIVFQTELRHSAKFLAQFSQHSLVTYFDMIRQVVREGQQQGAFRREISDKIAANCFFGALDEMVTSWMLSDRDYPLVGAADAVVDVIVTGLETRPSNGPSQR
jgi:TetR/AcrR family transcriptional regulator, fatty acid metabolism regulator protein